jgi:hypothetical protein
MDVKMILLLLILVFIIDIGFVIKSGMIKSIHGVVHIFFSVAVMGLLALVLLG